jgi:hypothetical protein
LGGERGFARFGALCFPSVNFVVKPADSLRANPDGLREIARPHFFINPRMPEASSLLNLLTLKKHCSPSANGLAGLRGSVRIKSRAKKALPNYRPFFCSAALIQEEWRYSIQFGAVFLISATLDTAALASPQESPSTDWSILSA